MCRKYKVAIIGGGASGLLCATELLTGINAFWGEEVVILDRNDRLGKKLIATGNGQGNLTNADLSPSHYYGEKKFIDDFWDNAKNINLIDYFYRLGIPLIDGDDGKYYPLSFQASSTLDILREYLAYKNCQIFTSTFVEKIEKRLDVFVLHSSSGDIEAEYIVLCTGGKAAKQFGTDGSAYSLAECFGHRTTKLFPSLVQIKTETQFIKGLKGIKEKTRLTLLDGDKVLGESMGDLLFTDYGLSGNSVFALSPKIVMATKPIISIDFLPTISKNSLKELLIGRAKLKHIDKDNILTGIINKKTGQSIVRLLKEASIDNIVTAVKDTRIKVIGTLGFDYAQTTRGGIITDDINPCSLCSKLEKNLYIVGEMLNVDGDCGGYNLSFAFLSGILAARNIKNKEHT